MAYVFNMGRGDVTCDTCGKLIDSGISYQEYEHTWGKHGDDGDCCMLCRIGKPPKKFDTKKKKKRK